MPPPFKPKSESDSQSVIPARISSRTKSEGVTIDQKSADIQNQLVKSLSQGSVSTSGLFPPILQPVKVGSNNSKAVTVNSTQQRVSSLFFTSTKLIGTASVSSTNSPTTAKATFVLPSASQLVDRQINGLATASIQPTLLFRPAQQVASSNNPPKGPPQLQPFKTTAVTNFISANQLTQASVVTSGTETNLEDLKEISQATPPLQTVKGSVQQIISPIPFTAATSVLQAVSVIKQHTVTQPPNIVIKDSKPFTSITDILSNKNENNPNAEKGNFLLSVFGISQNL